MSLKLLHISLLFSLLAAPGFAQKRAIVPAGWPKPASPPNFSPGILVDGTLYVAGQMGSDPVTGKFPSTFEDEVKTAFENIGAVLKTAGMSFDDVVSVTVYLSDMDLFQRMNAVYRTYFHDPVPARSTVGVAKLASPLGHLEITVTAHK
jgi:2-iminobutanoate/2-iminopropanoate deaminase